MNIATKYSKTVGLGGCGKCRVYYSEKFKRKVVEKTVDENILISKDKNRTRSKTKITKYTNNENLLKKEMIFMLLTKVAKLPYNFNSNIIKI